MGVIMSGSIPKNPVPDFSKLQAIVAQEQPIISADFLGRRYVKQGETEYKISSLMESLKNSICSKNSTELTSILDFIKNAEVKSPNRIKDLILKIHDCFRKKIFNQKIECLEAQINKKAEAEREAAEEERIAQELREKQEKVQALEQEVAEKIAARDQAESALNSEQRTDYDQKRQILNEQIAAKEAAIISWAIYYATRENNTNLQQDIRYLKAQVSSIPAEQAAEEAAYNEKCKTIEAKNAEIAALQSQLQEHKEQLTPKPEGEVREERVESAEPSLGAGEVAALSLENAREVINANLDEAFEVLWSCIDLIPEEQREKITVKIEGYKISFDFSKVNPRTLAIDVPQVMKLPGPLAWLFFQFNMGKKGKKRAIFITFNDSVEVSLLGKNSISIEGIKIKSKIYFPPGAKKLINYQAPDLNISRVKSGDAEMPLKGITLSGQNAEDLDLTINTGWGTQEIRKKFSIPKNTSKEDIVTILTQYSKASVEEYINKMKPEQKKSLALKCGIIDQGEKSLTEKILKEIEKENIIIVPADRSEFVRQLQQEEWHAPDNVFLCDLKDLPK
jgi:hypothetical protein